jgi:ATP-dependent helicase HrpB
MADTGLHPRLGRLLVEAECIGLAAVGADLVALLGERDILRSRQGGRDASWISGSDLMDRLELLSAMRRCSHEPSLQEVDRGAFAAIERSAQHLRRQLRAGRSEQLPALSQVGRLCAVAWPDRIALRRADGETYLLASGTGARLAPGSAVRNAPLLVALDVEGGRGADAVIRMATSLEMEDLRQLFPAEICVRRSVAWDQRAGRVVARSDELYGALLLNSRMVRPEPAEAVTALLSGVRMAGGSEALPWRDSTHRFLARVRFLARYCQEDGWPDLSFASLDAHLDQWLAPVAENVTTLDGLAKVDLEQAVRRLLSPHQLQRLRQGAPESLPVPSGRTVPLTYAGDEPPVLAVKLQEMFGLARTPVVAFGRVPVTIHLLSPAGRPLQVTSDLASFWDNVYPAVKKEMKGRYPRHPWPDDPWQAPATRGTKKSGS